MVPMNSSTVSPWSTWTFAKTSSAMSGFSCCAAWPMTDAVASTYSMQTNTTRTTRRIVRLGALFMFPRNVKIRPL